MKTITKTIAKLELAQIGWVVSDINAAVKFFANTLSIDFPRPETFRAQDFGLTYYGHAVPAEWLISQAYNGHVFIELIQPVSGQSVFQDYIDRHPAGGVQHLAYRLPVAGFEPVVADLRRQGYAVITEVNHPVARMAFFDTYQALGVATEIMGVTPEGWAAIEQMQKPRT